jgi:alkanesulfonate monooxygenase SsuD/methylene tetrahydromethanopterin reductase-like flavin-dependent oxidoreductase (luciferase family)
LGVAADYHGSGQAAADTLDVMQHLWDFKTGDPDYRFEMPTHRASIRRRVTPAPYRKRHPTIIRTASRDAAIVRAAQNGWPAFLGTFSCESPLPDQVRAYRKTLAQAGHSQDVVEECLRWCTCDWLAVVVADTDAEAEKRAAEAKAEHLTLRNAYVAAHGPLRGPVVNPTAGQSAASAYAAGGDMRETIAGNPDTVAAKVQELVDLGINHLLVRFMGEWTGETRHISEQSMLLFAREIMPRFKHIPPLHDARALNRHAMI